MCLFFWFCFLCYVLQLLFCRESWGSKWYPCTGSRGTRPLPFPSGNDHRDQNQSTVFPANIKQKSMHFGVFKAFAILSPSKQSTSSIVKNHQKSPNITKHHQTEINALCSFKVFAMMCFGMKATLGTFGENMPKPFEDILRVLLHQFLSWETGMTPNPLKSHWNLWSWAPGLFSRASRKRGSASARRPWSWRSPAMLLRLCKVSGWSSPSLALPGNSNMGRLHGLHARTKGSPCSFQAKVLTGDFVEKGSLQNTSPSKRVPPNSLQNRSLRNPKWLPTTK